MYSSLRSFFFLLILRNERKAIDFSDDLINIMLQSIKSLTNVGPIHVPFEKCSVEYDRYMVEEWYDIFRVKNFQDEK